MISEMSEAMVLFSHVAGRGISRIEWVNCEKISVDRLNVLAAGLGKHHLERTEALAVFLEGNYLPDSSVKPCCGQAMASPHPPLILHQCTQMRRLVTGR
jgi:hypothetical protein